MTTTVPGEVARPTRAILTKKKGEEGWEGGKSAWKSEKCSEKCSDKKGEEIGRAAVFLPVKTGARHSAVAPHGSEARQLHPR